MLTLRSVFILTACLCVFIPAACLPASAAAVISPSSRIVGDPANDVTLEGYVETAGATVTIQAVNQNTGDLVTLGTATAAASGTSYTPPSGPAYTAYAWSFDAGVLALNYWAPQSVVADVATAQGHLELIASSGGQTLATFSPAAFAAALASHDDPQTAATKYADGKSTVLFDRNGVGSGPESPWVTVAGMISTPPTPGYAPVAWSVGYYKVEGGMKIYGLICAPTTGGPYPVVIYNHGGTGSTDGGGLSGFVLPSGWTEQPILLGPDDKPFISPITLTVVPVPDSLGQCLDWAKRGWVFATSAYRGESVTITSASPDFKTPAKPWASDGRVEFCMGEVTDVLALTDLLVNHPSSIGLGNTSQRIPIKSNGELFMYGYSHGGCITYPAVAMGAPVKAFAVIEGFTDLRLTYLTARNAGLTAAQAAVGSGAFQPDGAWDYLPDVSGVMGYNWRSGHYYASRGDLKIAKFKTMPILILQGDIDTGNPVFLDQAAAIATDIDADKIFVGPTGLTPPTSEPCIAGPEGAPLPAALTAPNASCPISFIPKNTGDACVSGATVPPEMTACPVVALPLTPAQLHDLVVFHNMNHVNGGLAIKATFDGFAELYFKKKPGCDGLEGDCATD